MIELDQQAKQWTHLTNSSAGRIRNPREATNGTRTRDLTLTKGVLYH